MKYTFKIGTLNRQEDSDDTEEENCSLQATINSNA